MINTYVTVYTDGACSGNPGPGAIGVVVLDENGQEVGTCKECIGETTNNRAEYKAVIRGLELAAGICRRKVICCSDSELVVKQLNGRYRVKNTSLRILYENVVKLTGLLEKFSIQHVPRARSTEVDSLANKALDRL